MRKTPERRVKDQVQAVMNKYTPYVYWRMPVSRGMGIPGLDYYGSCCGLFFEIETKAEGKKLTPRQMTTTGAVEASCGIVFAIRELNDPMLDELDAWLNLVVTEYLEMHRA